MQHSFYKRQKGFTLLELLVVITLLATLATAALVAYDGVGASAAAGADANSISTGDQAIRAYKATAKAYPNQWDNLVDTAGAPLVTLDTDTKEFLAAWNNAGTSGVGAAIAASFLTVGIDTLQGISATSNTALPADISPNVWTNESAGGVQLTIGAATPYAVVANGAAGTCEVETLSIATPMVGAVLANSNALNLISDAFENDECNMVIALGFGHDVPGSTSGKAAAIKDAGSSGVVTDKSKFYSRYLALFHVAEDGDGAAADGNIVAAEVHATPHFVGLVNPHGHTIDDAVQNSSTAN